MQPFEETCKGRLSLLALKVLADSKGVVWMYGESVILLKHISCAPRKGDSLFHTRPSKTYLLVYLMEFHAPMLIFRLAI